MATRVFGFWEDETMMKGGNGCRGHVVGVRTSCIGGRLTFELRLLMALISEASPQCVPSLTALPIQKVRQRQRPWKKIQIDP